MSDRNDYARIPVAAIGALAGEAAADFEIRLPGSSGGVPTLYRKSGADLALPDYQRIREQGVTHLFVRTEDLGKCEAILECKLATLLRQVELTPAEKAGIVHDVGVSVARDLTRTPDPGAPGPDLQRVGNVVDNVIGCVLHDPLVASQLLHMADHEYTVASHMFIVSALAVLLGVEVYGSDHEMLRALGFAGMLHDLGKLAVGSAILNKSEALSPEEIHLIEQHPIESVRLIGDAPQATPLVRQMILQHHERVDGKGYPIGVCGANLPPSSRIIAIADSFHAMIGRRPNRRPMTALEANKVLNNLAGKQFDADILACWNLLFDRCQSSSQPVCLAVKPSPDAMPSSKHEHRLTPPPRKSHCQRATRTLRNGNVTVRCVYAGRLPYATSAPNEFIAPVHDVSRGGLCIYTAHPLYRGEVLHLQLGSASQKTWVRAAVAWCRQRDANSYRTGLRFGERIPETEARNSVPLEELAGALRRQDDETQRDHPTVPESSTTPPKRDLEDVKLGNAHETLAAVAAMRDVPPQDERTVIILSTAADAEIRQKSIDVLAGIGTRPAREAISVLLKDADPMVRERAAATAGTLRMQESSYQLRKLLQDPVESVALRSAGALGRLGDQAGLPKVIAVLRARGDNARLAAAVFGEIVGHRFSSNAEGIRAATRYIEAQGPQFAECNA